MAKQITVTIGPNGETEIATAGFSGSDCLKETMDLERKLGATTKDTKTREFTTTNAAVATQKARS